MIKFGNATFVEGPFDIAEEYLQGILSYYSTPPFNPIYRITRNSTAEIEAKVICEPGKIPIGIKVIGGFNAWSENPINMNNVHINSIEPLEISLGGLNSYYIDDHTYRSWGSLKWILPISNLCDNTYKIIPTSSQGWIRLTFAEISLIYCNLEISSLTGSSQTINPTLGQSLTIVGNINDSSGQPINWTVKLLDRTFTGSGTSVSITWDGKDASSKIVEPGSYTVSLTAQTADGQCVASKTINITVVKPLCDLKIASLTANSQTINPSLGQSLTISGNITNSSVQPISTAEGDAGL